MAVVLKHPKVSPTLTVTLPNPRLGEADTFDNRSRYKIAMSGRVRSYIFTPSKEKLVLDFDDLKPAEVNDLINFINTVEADEIEFTDWTDKIWWGRITSGPIRLTSTGRNSCSEVRHILVEFEGLIVGDLLILTEGDDMTLTEDGDRIDQDG